jgi:type IV conjugative transfer system lipoprotein TraV
MINFSRRFLQKLCFLNLLFLTASCSNSVKGNWTCPTLDGGKGSCVSISEADAIKSTSDSSNSKQQNFSYVNSAQKIEIKLIAPRLSELKKIEQEKAKNQIGTEIGNFEPVQVSSPTAKLRTPEKVGKVWFAPHIDADGNQHSQSIVYVVDQEPKWLMTR